MTKNAPNISREDLLIKLGEQINRINKTDGISGNAQSTDAAIEEFVLLYTEGGDPDVILSLGAALHTLPHQIAVNLLLRCMGIMNEINKSSSLDARVQNAIEVVAAAAEEGRSISTGGIMGGRIADAAKVVSAAVAKSRGGAGGDDVGDKQNVAGNGPVIFTIGGDQPLQPEVRVEPGTYNSDL